MQMVDLISATILGCLFMVKGAMTAVAKLFWAAIFIFISVAASAQDAVHKDTWHSPQSQSADWPHLGASDCAAYGSSYGYAECDIMKRPPQRPNISTPAPYFAEKSAAKAKAAPEPFTREETGDRPRPAYVRADRTAQSLLLQVTLGAKSVVRKSSCIGKMDSCYADCKGTGQTPDRCNLSCKTDGICSAPLSLNYGQFLEFQIEMLAIPRDDLAKMAKLLASTADNKTKLAIIDPN